MIVWIKGNTYIKWPAENCQYTTANPGLWASDLPQSLLFAVAPTCWALLTGFNSVSRACISVVGRIMPPTPPVNIHVLIHRTEEIKGADGIKVANQLTLR